MIGLVVWMPSGDSLCQTASKTGTLFHNSLSFRNEVPMGLRLQMNPDDFGEVMGNLLDNARKFATAHVLVLVRAASGMVEVIVSDAPGGGCRLSFQVKSVTF